MISIIMPAYNEEKYIGLAINSILSQKYGDFELIIINDGSTDRTSDIINEVAITDSRITVIEPGKVGKNAAFNIASELVTGDWIYFMGADDVMPDYALKKLFIKVENLNPNDPIVINGKMKIISDFKKYNGLILPKNKKRFNFSGPLTLMSKEVLKKISPIPEDFPNEDTWWSLYFRFFVKKIFKIDQIIIYYRVHDNNAISRSSCFNSFSNKYHKRYIIRERFMTKYKNNLNSEDINILKTELILENCRFSGNTLKIIFLKNVSFKNKLRAIMFSNKIFYRIKIRFDRFFLGR